MTTKRKIAVVMDLEWPYKRHYEIFAGIREFATEHGDWQFHIGNFPQSEMSCGTRFDGIVGRISPNCLAAARKKRVPLVNVWIDSPVASVVPGVHPDFRAAGRMAADHLIVRGLQRLAHFGFKGSTASKLHYEGMREVAREHGFTCIRHVVAASFADKERSWENFVEYVGKAQAGWVAPMGVCFAADELAHAVSAICIDSGWNIPGSLAVIGTNNETLICNAAKPSLSSIDMADRRCGYEAARLLHRLMEGSKAPKEILCVPPKELVLRRSSDAYAVSDPAMVTALGYMAKHVDQKISVWDVANAAGIGRQSLERRFRLQLNRTVNDELIRLRISKMKRLLVETEQNIGELSAKVGFGTTANMHVMFKRQTGMTPIAYRNKHSQRPMPNRDGPERS